MTTEKNSNYFLICGPPAMGKSTLLRHIPGLIRNATSIDLEHSAFASNHQSELRNFAQQLIKTNWKHPLFLGCAGGNAIEIAKAGYRVIALHHNNQEHYKKQREIRDVTRESGKQKQGDHWEYHEKLFAVEMPANQIEPLLVDTLSADFDGKAEHTVRYITQRLELEIWPDMNG